MPNIVQVEKSICGKLVLHCIGGNELPCTCYRVKGGESFYLKDNATGKNYMPFNFETAVKLLSNEASNMEFIG